MTKYKPNELGQILDKLVKVAHDLSDDNLSDQILDIAHELRGKTLMSGVPPPTVLQDLKNLLQDLGVEFALIGGLAVGVHGDPRGTDDIDVLVSKLPDAQKIADLEYMAKFNFYRGKSRTGEHLVLDNKKGQTELLVANNDLRRWALETATEENILLTKLKVVSAAALIGLKLQAISSNPKREAKDKADIVSVLFTSKPKLDKVKEFLTEKEVAMLETLTK